MEIGPKASAAAQWRTECAISPGTPHIIRTAVRHCLRTSRAAIVSPSAQPFAALLPFSLSSGENDIMEKQATHRGAGVSGGDRGGGQPRRRRRDAGLRLGPAGLNVCRPLARMMFVAVQPCRLALDVASACCSRVRASQHHRDSNDTLLRATYAHPHHPHVTGSVRGGVDSPPRPQGPIPERELVPLAVRLRANSEGRRAGWRALNGL